MNAGGRAPILVLGVGNALLQDDGVGPALIELLRATRGADPRVELVDGGTLGLALLGWIEHRGALLVLDAVEVGAAPGTVHVIERPLDRGAARGIGAHGGNAASLLGTAALLGVLPHQVLVIGVEPRSIRTGTELDPVVARALPRAAALAGSWLDARLAELREGACTS
ncbi:MAG: hydrogenase maturation protease [Planctomycetes bacterium]|nr:hydrogenase maturation protease [Planctomycetota bacterium]